MTKQWLKADEFALYASCQGDSRFITPPENLTEEDVDHVEYTCHRCPVRPECGASVVQTAASGVWSCSVFIPEVSIHDSPRRARYVLEQAQEIRDHLASTIPDELGRRGDF